MSEAATIQEMDQVISESLAAGGFGDSGLYTDTLVASLPLTNLYIDAQRIDPDTGVVHPFEQAFVILFRTDQVLPELKGELVVDSDTFILEEKKSSDHARTRWLCRKQ